MRIQFVAPTSNYTQLPNGMIRCRELSYRAVGLYAYVRSLPPGASTTLETLAKLKAEGKDAVHKARRELEDAGFLRVVEERNKGQYAGAVWMLADRPHEFDGLLPGADGEITDAPAPAPRPKRSSPREAIPDPELPMGLTEAEAPAARPEAARPQAATPSPENPSPVNPPHYKTDPNSTLGENKTEQGSPKVPADVSGLIEAWNEFADTYRADGIPRVERLSEGKRLTQIRARMRDRYWRENFRDGILQIPHQRWRMGINSRDGMEPWRANIEWFTRPDTLDKLLEERQAMGDRVNSGQRSGDLSSVRPGSFD